MQNIWEQKGYGLYRQKRRAQVIRKYLKNTRARTILDCGCSEGYTTSFISEVCDSLVGLELDIETIRIAKAKVRRAHFINGSIKFLPFRENYFDVVCILEVLEHLNEGLQRECVQEVDRVLKIRGKLLISVPFKERISYTRCVHCLELTPLYGHVHSLDEETITALMPNNSYKLTKKYHMPNIGIISCSSLLEPFPIWLWTVINDSLGLIRKGYWIILQYVKHEVVS